MPLSSPPTVLRPTSRVRPSVPKPRPHSYSEDELDWLENASRSPDEVWRVDAAFWAAAAVATMLLVAAAFLIVRACAAA